MIVHFFSGTLNLAQSSTNFFSGLAYALLCRSVWIQQLTTARHAVHGRDYDSDVRLSFAFSRRASKCHEPRPTLMTTQTRRDFSIFKVDRPRSRPTSGGQSHELISRLSNFACAGFSCRCRFPTRNVLHRSVQLITASRRNSSFFFIYYTVHIY